MINILMPELKESLRDLADIEYQRRVWLRPDGPEFSSFDELICQVFDDTALSDVIDKPYLEDLVGKDAAESLRILDRAAAKIEANITPAKFIELPEMAKLRELAQRALEDLERAGY